VINRNHGINNVTEWNCETHQAHFAVCGRPRRVSCQKMDLPLQQTHLWPTGSFNSPPPFSVCDSILSRLLNAMRRRAATYTNNLVSTPHLFCFSTLAPNRIRRHYNSCKYFVLNHLKTSLFSEILSMSLNLMLLSN